jgi:UDP-N-acetylglucosamine--N-acetylmuramyl-(pentapeptide) pyrophosphoryl-undecaprenol N-acetylglucosamine transferase
MSRAGAAVVLPDAELTPARLREEVLALLGDGARLAAMADAARGLARPQAARDVAAEVLRAAAR